MRSAILILALFAISAARAQGVNDRLPNGQQGFQPYAQAPPPSNVTPPTPNASGQYYTWRLRRQMLRQPRVHGSIRYRSR